MIKGIDVSAYQSPTYTTTGLDFVFVKATEGRSYVNSRMNRQAAVARTAGLALGFYHFMHPGNIQAQAEYFVDRAASLQGDMLVCDWETTLNQGRPTNAEKDQFIRAVKKLRPGHKVGLYCNLDYWKNRDTTGYAGDFLWIADPEPEAGHPRIKAAWKFHQYSISGQVDRNVGNFKSRATLRTWCGYGDKPPAVTRDDQQDKKIKNLTDRVEALEEQKP